VRPTSETVIGAAMARWVQSWRDLPLMVNQWANVVRWEMRTRMFLRTSEFLWQEGHTAHANRDDAMAETLRAGNVSRFCRKRAGAAGGGGRKARERAFPRRRRHLFHRGDDAGWQGAAGGHQPLPGTGFAEAAGIRYQSKEGAQELAHTTSWGVSTRMIGGVIMTHGDDDGLRVPPAIAPHQIILPMLREDDGDEALLAYCEELRRDLAKLSALGEPIRVQLDKRAGKATQKRWGWVKKGAPIILEIGGRDAANGQVSALRRDDLWRADAKVNFRAGRDEFVAAAGLLEDIQHSLHTQAPAPRCRHHARHHHAGRAGRVFQRGQALPRLGGAELEPPHRRGAGQGGGTVEGAQADHPQHAAGCRPAEGLCPFTGEPAVERIYVARAY
jgi:prolyl-tRNA synthetase